MSTTTLREEADTADSIQESAMKLKSSERIHQGVLKVAKKAPWSDIVPIDEELDIAYVAADICSESEESQNSPSPLRPPYPVFEATNLRPPESNDRGFTNWWESPGRGLLHPPERMVIAQRKS